VVWGPNPLGQYTVLGLQSTRKVAWLPPSGLGFNQSGLGTSSHLESGNFEKPKYLFSASSPSSVFDYIVNEHEKNSAI